MTGGVGEGIEPKLIDQKFQVVRVSDIVVIALVAGFFVEVGLEGAEVGSQVTWAPMMTRLYSSDVSMGFFAASACLPARVNWSMRHFQ